MIAAAPIGLTVPGMLPRSVAVSRTVSGVPHGSAEIGGAVLGAQPLGVGRSKPKAYTYAGLTPSGAELGLAVVGGAVLGGMRRPIARKVKRQTATPLRAAWATGQARAAAERGAWGRGTQSLTPRRAAWPASTADAAAQRAPWPLQHAADSARGLPWAEQRVAAVAQLAERPAPVLGRIVPGLAAVGGAPRRSMVLDTGSRLDAARRAPWIIARPRDAAERAAWAVYAQAAQTAERAAWTVARSVDAGRRLPWALYGARADAGQRNAFASARRADTPERFPFGARRALGAGWGVVIEPGDPIIEPGQPIIIPVRRAYLMLHDVSVVRVSDNQAISAKSINLSLDADSGAWSWQGTLLGSDVVDAVRPDSSGTAVILAIAIDGYVFNVLVEDWTEDRSVGKRAITAKGRGLSALLATPYQLAVSGATGSEMTLQQVLNAHLPFGAGWTIAWAPGTPDWLVPAGAWTWANQSPFAAIYAAASGVGLVVRPDIAAQTLTIQPRYPVLPWAFSGATPDIVVPDSAILALGRRNVPPSQANAAFVAGGNVGGVLARVYREGTAGDRALAAVQHPLITHADAARLLGSRLLAAQAQQPDVRSVQIPLDGSTFGLGLPGQLLEAQIDGVASRGIVNGVQIDVQRTDKALTVRQTLTIGEDTPNVWAGFSRLLPQDPLRPAVIQAEFADGTASVEYPDGGTQRVRNPNGLALGASVYVRGGRIDGAAPSLAAVDITV